jgi:O-antigen ligase
MSSEKVRWHSIITIATLSMAIVFLPFSITLCHGSLILLTLNWIIEGNWKSKWQTLKTAPLVWPFIFLFLFHGIGLIYSEDKINGLFNLEKKIAFISLPVIISTIPITQKHFNLLLKIFVSSCIIGFIICLITAFSQVSTEAPSPINFDAINSEEFNRANPKAIQTWSYFSYQGLSSGIKMHPTYLGVYILFAVIILISFFKKERNYFNSSQKVGVFILLLFLSLAIMMLSSRIVIISYFLIFLISVCWVLYNQSGVLLRNLLLSILVIFSVSILIIFINPVAQYRLLRDAEDFSFKVKDNEFYTKSTSIRFSLWWLGWQSIKENNKYIGVGTGDVIRTVEKTGAKFGISNILNSYDPHNQFIYTTLGLGFIGLLLLLACLFFPFIYQSASLNFLHLSFIGIVFLICLTESFFELQKGIVFFSIFNSLLIFQKRPDNIIT